MLRSLSAKNTADDSFRLIDRFVNGESVADAALGRVWQNTTVPQPLWDVPIYEEFFRAVRAVNASLPRERRLRVLLGDPPIDWDTIRSEGQRQALNLRLSSR